MKTVGANSRLRAWDVLIKLAIGVSATLCAGSALAGDKGKDKNKDSLCEWLAAEGPAYLSATGGPGLAVGIVDQGRLRCGQGFGVRRLGATDPVTASTNFHMASVSKTFVAAAIVKLVSDGRVRLDDTVTQFIPSFRLIDPRFRKITLRHLLNHTSGLPDVEDYGWDKPQRDEQALSRYVGSLKTLRLRSAPGSRFHYSNIGTEVLGAVIARVSGVSFEDFVAARLLVPTGMDRSSFIYVPGQPAEQAAPHVIDASGQRVTSQVYPFSRSHGPSSTLQSNVIDMARWLGAMSPTRPDNAHPFLTTAQRRTLFTPLRRDISKDEPDRIPSGVQVALAWFVIPYQTRQLIAHPGADQGFASLIVLDPTHKTGVVVLTNADQTEPAGMTKPNGLPDLFGFDLAARILDRLATP
jgi:CubicO group peptidase (beta-lactamase class C family)